MGDDERRDLQAAIAAALKADRAARSEERTGNLGALAAWIISAAVLGVPALLLLWQVIDHRDDHEIACGRVIYTGDIADYPDCKDLGAVP